MLDQKSVDVYQSAPDEISITEIFYKLWRVRHYFDAAYHFPRSLLHSCPALTSTNCAHN